MHMHAYSEKTHTCRESAEDGGVSVRLSNFKRSASRRPKRHPLRTQRIARPLPPLIASLWCVYGGARAALPLPLSHLAGARSELWGCEGVAICGGEAAASSLPLFLCVYERARGPYPWVVVLLFRWCGECAC